LLVVRFRRLTVRSKPSPSGCCLLLRIVLPAHVLLQADRPRAVCLLHGTNSPCSSLLLLADAGLPCMCCEAGTRQLWLHRKLGMPRAYLPTSLAGAAWLAPAAPALAAAASDQSSSSTCSAIGRVRMRGSPAAAAARSSLSGLLVPLRARLGPGAAGAGVGSLLLLLAPKTVVHSSGVTPDEAGTRSGATLLAVAYLDRSSTSLGARLRGTPQPRGAEGLEEGAGPFTLVLRAAGFLPSSSTRPAMLRCPAPGVPGPLGAGAAALSALPGDTTLALLLGEGVRSSCRC
jgi:hypothetical protein